MDDSRKDSSQELDGLRRQIDEIDEQLVQLLAERQKQVGRVVELKKRYSLPVYHPAREEDVITGRREQARRMGLNPDFVEELYRIIIRQSRIEQSGHLARKAIRPGAAVLIVGGHGEMGRYFARCFDAAGYEVRLMGRNDWDRIESLCTGIDMAMVSVPIESTAEIIDRLGPHLPSHAVLTDITSIKSEPLKSMLCAHSGPVLGLHPLFGPTPASLDKQIIVATPGRDQEKYQWILDQFAAWGAVVVISDPDEHDEVMSVVQALRHFATFSFGQFLAKRNVPLARTLEFSSPIYRLELGMVGRLFAQDAALYAEIIFSSKKRLELLKSYIEGLSANMSMLESGDKADFIAQFNQIAEWFGPFGEQAMRESSFLIDKLIERF